MTLNELKTEVAALGFETGAIDDSVFIGAANRALAMIYTDLPRLKTLYAPACPIEPTYRLASIHHSAGERIELPLSGRAYSFFVSGSGEFTKVTPLTRTTSEFDTPLSEYRGIIDGDVTLIFEGNGDYEVLNLSTYDRLVGDGAEGIPRDGRVRIDPDGLTDDFAAFAEAPRDADGEIILGAEIDGRELILPAGYRGVVSIRYERRPKRISAAVADIDISPERAHLLPLLTAYFVWIDDEPELAERYRRLYGELAAAERRRGARTAEYVDALRWA